MTPPKGSQQWSEGRQWLKHCRLVTTLVCKLVGQSIWLTTINFQQNKPTKYIINTWIYLFSILVFRTGLHKFLAPRNHGWWNQPPAKEASVSGACKRGEAPRSNWQHGPKVAEKLWLAKGCGLWTCQGRLEKVGQFLGQGRCWMVQVDYFKSKEAMKKQSLKNGPPCGKFQEFRPDVGRKEFSWYTKPNRLSFVKFYLQWLHPPIQKRAKMYLSTYLHWACKCRCLWWKCIMNCKIAYDVSNSQARIHQQKHISPKNGL